MKTATLNEYKVVVGDKVYFVAAKNELHVMDLLEVDEARIFYVGTLASYVGMMPGIIKEKDNE